MTVQSKLVDAHQAATDAIAAKGDPTERYDDTLALLAWHAERVEALRAQLIASVDPES